MELKTDKRLEKIITDAIQRQLSELTLPPGINFKDVPKHIRLCMRHHPEIFWFSNQYKLDTTTQTLYFYYNFTPQKKDFYAKEIKKVVEYLFQPNALKHLSDREKVTYVYKWIANNTTYNEYSSFNQTIFSVLINRNSVCTGYAKTAQFLLNILGIQSELVFGKFHADNSNTGRHGWNIVKIDGDWYHIDFCLADPALKYLLNMDESPIEYDGLIWNYFCKPTEYILKNRNIEFLEYYPICNKEINTKIAIPLIKPLKQLGVSKSDSGTSAIVYLDSLNKNRVIKIPRENYDLIDHEFKILEILQGCKHIVRLEGRTHSGLLLEQLTPLSELFNSHYYHPNEKQLKNILLQLTQGLIECRDRGITYSDIHYNNVFVSKEGFYKWGDFGMAFPSRGNGTIPSKLIGPDGIALGSQWFMAPETYYNSFYTESSAIYSLAMLAYFVMNNMRPPFWTNEKFKNKSLNQRLNGEIIQAPVFIKRYKNLWMIIRKALSFYSELRPSSYEKFISELDRDFFIKHNISAVDMGGNQMNVINIGSDIFNDMSNKDSIDDLFASSNQIDKKNCLPSNNGGKTWEPPHHYYWHHERYYDTDSFACTCGIGDQNEDVILPVRRKTYGLPKSKPNEKVSFWDMIFGRKEKSEIINTSVYAPAEVTPQKHFIVRVFIHRHNESNIINKIIKEIDKTAVKKANKPFDLPIKKGDKITIQFSMTDGVTIDEPIQQLVWKGQYLEFDFVCEIKKKNLDSIMGKVMIFINNVPSGDLKFTIEILPKEKPTIYCQVKPHRYSKIFISYAHEDEFQVKGIAEGCKMLGTDYFFDRHSLQAGDIFKDKILKYINDADLFVLCWSKNAAESEWVQIERQHALQLIYEGKSTLSIYPISLSPEAPLPGDMSDKYNFGKL